jgi:hypothetical protein
MTSVFSLCGYDASLIAKVSRGERAFFVVSAAFTLVAVFLAGSGMAYGFVLTSGPWAALPAFAAGALFVLNLLRLQHAGSGYPLHLPIEDIQSWRPGLAGLWVLLVFGLLLGQPLVILLQKPWLDDVVAARIADANAVRQALGLETSAVVDGLIVRGSAAWSEHFAASALLTVVCALILAAPALLRFIGASAVRDYESERWIADRILVDDEWAVARDVIETTLTFSAPGWRPPLVVPFADPPYNTRPLIFGIDTADIVEGRLRLTRLPRAKREATPVLPPPRAPWWAELDLVQRPPSEPSESAQSPEPSEPSVRASSTHAAAASSAPTPPSIEFAASPAPPRAPAPNPMDTSSPTEGAASVPSRGVLVGSVVEVGRIAAGQARGSVAVMALCARYLECSGAEVFRALREAPDDAPLHTVFPSWGRLPTVLLKPASVALDLGLAPLIAIAVGRPTEQVERRLRAVAGDQKVSSVFAPELARRLLREKTPGHQGPP